MNANGWGTVRVQEGGARGCFALLLLGASARYANSFDSGENLQRA
jgi:hypothetical protein